MLRREKKSVLQNTLGDHLAFLEQQRWRLGPAGPGETVKTVLRHIPVPLQKRSVLNEKVRSGAQARPTHIGDVQKRAPLGDTRAPTCGPPGLNFAGLG